MNWNFSYGDRIRVVKEPNKYKGLIGAVGTYLLRRWRYLSALPPIVANTLIIPFVIRYAYVDVTESLPFLFFTVGLGEILSVGVLGTLLLLALEKHRAVFE